MSTTPSIYPRKTTINLQLELEIEGGERDAYIFAEPLQSSVLQIGFIADLFDLLNFESDLGVQKINGWTHEQIKKILSGQATPEAIG